MFGFKRMKKFIVGEPLESPIRGKRVLGNPIDDACNMSKDDIDKVIDLYNKDSKLPLPQRRVPMPECKPSRKDSIKELYNWLKGERYGYFLEDHKTWINYGELDDKFPYDEKDKKWELSRNRMIEKTLRKIEELGLIKQEDEE
jgi:hypothetical protein